jgi:hypothetical protein
VPLTADWIRSGVIVCPYCSGTFEGTLFTPPERRKQSIVEIATVGPEGAAACANHALNAATTSCQRCGLFICTLCDMNLGSGSYCPSCFERVHNEGTLQSESYRYRDYAAIARTCAIFGLVGFHIGIGLLTVYYGIKGRKQRRAHGRPAIGVTIALIVGLFEVLAMITFYGFLVWAMVKA